MAEVVEARITRSVDVVSLYGSAARRFFTRVMLAAHESAVGHAPVDKGVLRGGLAPGAGVTMVDPAEPPQFARVGPVVTPYPRVLDESDQTHYRAGPFVGQPTKGWLSERTRQDAQAAMADALPGLAREIEQGWRHG